MTSRERFIALRFLFKGTEKGRFSPMTVFAWLAIAVGVSAMSCLLSVMYGFESALKERVLKAYPHVMVKPKEDTRPITGYAPWTEAFEQVPGVARVTPFVETEMIAQTDGRAMGAVVLGLPEAEMARKRGEVTEGSLPSASSDVPQAMLGAELARRLGVYVGDQIKVISPIETTGAFGLAPKALTFQVSGLYASGHYEYDQQYLILLIEDAQSLVKKGDAITGWQIWAASESDSESVQESVASTIPPIWEAQSWAEFNSALFHSLRLEQYSMFIILTFAIVIAVMNIGITLTMYVTQKRKNIGILRALGASRAQVRKIFLWQGMLLGGAGLALGAILTVGFLGYIKYFSSYRLPDIYYDRSLPIEVRPLSITVTYLIAVGLIFLATIYPAKKAMDVDPVEAMRR